MFESGTGRKINSWSKSEGQRSTQGMLKDRILVSGGQERVPRYLSQFPARPVHYNCWADESMLKAMMAVDQGTNFHLSLKLMKTAT